MKDQLEKIEKRLACIEENTRLLLLSDVMANKHAEEIMKYINEELLDRMKVGYSKGLFKTSVYYMAKEPTHANRLKVGLMSLFQGNQSSYSPLYAQNIDVSKEFDVLRVYQNQYVREETASGDALMLLVRDRKSVV